MSTTSAMMLVQPLVVHQGLSTTAPLALPLSQGSGWMCSPCDDSLGQLHYRTLINSSWDLLLIQMQIEGFYLMALQSMRAGKSCCVLMALHVLRVGFESCFGLLELSPKLSFRVRTESFL